MTRAFLSRFLLLAACVLAFHGCTVKQTETPPLAGPSEFALSFGVTATPDAISQDGGSSSTIALRAFDVNGKPKSGVTFRLDIFVGTTPVDYGGLSTKSVTTNGDGRATAVYTAPAPQPAGSNLPSCSPSIFSYSLPGGCVRIVATPIGSGFFSQNNQGVEIHLIPMGVILPPAFTPTARFSFTPSAPSANSPVAFNAALSCAGSSDGTATGCAASGQSLVSYVWNFGDGSSGSGQTVSHSFATAQTYNVTLTVTNDRGIAASTTQPITVGAGSAPTAAFVFSPTPAIPGAQVYFDASNSRPGLGHRIVQYKWNWGDGDPVVTSSSPIQQHDFTTDGTYTVLLTVVDEAGQIGTTTATVPVGVED